MKKYIFIIITVAISVIFSSCNEELENWYTETSSYDGRYVVSQTVEEAKYNEDNATIEDGNEIMLYNTAANVQNEIWLETHIAGVHIKVKTVLTGASAAFNGTGEIQNIVRTYLYGEDESRKGKDLTSTLAAPTAAGLTHPGYDLFSRISVGEGKILPKAATTIGGNPSDSFNLKMILHTDKILFESYQIPKEEWGNPDVPEFAWRIRESSRTPLNDWDEHWTLEGYRYTGYPEDH